MKLAMKCIRVFAVFLVCVTAGATVWYVHPDSTLNSIQNALDSCSNNDTVLVGPGMYYENVVWPNTYGIDLISEYGVDSTIIDGSSTCNVIRIDSGLVVDSMTTIRGFTITHGNSSSGGGIFVSYCDGPVVAGNRLTANTTMGISSYWSSPKIIDNYIVQNVGGIGSYADFTGIISGNIIVQNEYGAGIDLSSQTFRENTILNNDYGFLTIFSSPSIVRSQICNNASCGVSGYHTSPIIDSCTISDNDGDGISFGINYYENPQIHYSNITGNAGYGIMNNTGFTVSAEFNWWGHPSGPGGVGPGTGDEVSVNVSYTPWLTSPVGTGNICYPQESQYWTGRIHYVGYTKYDGDWWADYICAAEFRGWAKFDISSIPDNVEIHSVMLCAYDITTTPEDSTIDIYSIENDPVATTGQILFDDCGEGNLYVDSWSTASGWNVIELGEDAVEDLQNGLPDDWFAVGIAPDTFYDAVWFNGYGTATLKPYIIVTYATGITEDPGYTIHDSGINLDINPNPFSKLTTINFGIGHGAECIALSIYDAMGRVVRQWDYPTIRLSDHMHWDGTDQANRKLGSGVYFAELKMGDFSLTEKVILIQ